MSIVRPGERRVEPDWEEIGPAKADELVNKPTPKTAAVGLPAAAEDAAETKAEEALPIEAVEPVVRQDGLWPQVVALVHYMTQTEVHTYAFSVAANVILALFPFIVLMLTIAQQVFHSPAMVAVVGDLMHSLLPVSQDFVMRNMTILAHPHKGTQALSVFMLLVTTTGVFLPLEVALNEVWGVKKNRNYLMNQAVALGLAASVGVLVLASVGLTTVQKTVMGWIFFGHVNNWLFNFVAGGMLRICAAVASCLLFFLIYWILPNRKIPALAVLPTAVVVGLAWEIAKYLYVLALPRLDFESVYGPFRVTVGLMMWAFLSGLLLLAGAHFSANRYALKEAREAEAEHAG
jgi:YihY family inner membrane protein